MMHFLCIYLLLGTSLSHEVKRRQSGDDANFIFSTPEIYTVVAEDQKEFALEAFKSKENDYGKSDSFLFTSVGRPQLILPQSHQIQLQKCAVPHFVLTSSGFFFNVITLTNAHQVALAAVASQKYKTKIYPSQIIMLTPQDFTCTVEIETAKETISMQGRVITFRENPLEVRFKVRRGTAARSLLESATLTPEMVEITCEIVRRAQKATSDYLKISGSQLENLHLTDKLLGPASQKFVTRNQMSQLAYELQQSLNVVEIYESADGSFEPNFFQSFMDNFGGKDAFKPQPIGETLKQLSRYNFQGDLEPDKIFKELSDVLKIQISGSKSHIIVNRESDLLKKETSKAEVGGGYTGPLGVGGNAKFVNDHQSEWHQNLKSLDDQLKELNEQSTSHVKFERDGQTIIPKTLDVVQISSAQLQRQLDFSRIRKKLSSADFRRQFQLDLRTTKVFSPAPTTKRVRKTTTRTALSTTPAPTWGSWLSWSNCSVLCGGGSRQRSRNCTRNSDGCTGLSTEQADCNVHKCPDWSPWSGWFRCSTDCGVGRRMRFRSCEVENQCQPGEFFDVELCNRAWFQQCNNLN